MRYFYVVVLSDRKEMNQESVTFSDVVLVIKRIAFFDVLVDVR